VHRDSRLRACLITQIRHKTVTPTVTRQSFSIFKGATQLIFRIERNTRNTLQLTCTTLVDRVLVSRHQDVMSKTSSLCRKIGWISLIYAFLHQIRQKSFTHRFRRTTQDAGAAPHGIIKKCRMLDPHGPSNGPVAAKFLRCKVTSSRTRQRDWFRSRRHIRLFLPVPSHP
jgi:hypothetical protein